MPLASFHGMPLACTSVPGAWPVTSRRVLALARSTGRGPIGKAASHNLQARTSLKREDMYKTIWDFNINNGKMMALSPVNKVRTLIYNKELMSKGR